MNKQTKQYLERKIARAVALNRGIPQAIIDWRIQHNWPLAYLHCKTIDDFGMH